MKIRSINVFYSHSHVYGIQRIRKNQKSRKDRKVQAHLKLFQEHRISRENPGNRVCA